MIRNINLLLLLFIIVALPVFAQDIELPEPVYSGTQSVRVYTNPPGFWYPYFDEVVSYFRNFDQSDQFDESQQYENIVFLPGAMRAEAVVTDAPVPAGIRNNRYFLESHRLTTLAQRAFEEGDYAVSQQNSIEAVRYANLSDEFVRLQIKIKETNDSVTAAQARLAWASSGYVDAPRRFPTEFNRAQTSFDEARRFRSVEEFDNAILAARGVFNALALVTEIAPLDSSVSGIAETSDTQPAETTQPAAQVVETRPETPAAPAEIQIVESQPAEQPVTQVAETQPVTPVETQITQGQPVEIQPSEVQAAAPVVTQQVTPVNGVYPLPAQYTVRTWATTRDCLWNIAGRPWAYNDPNQWRLLYNANRAKMPQADNPDLIEPGMIIDIPSIRGEKREGMWAEGRAYEPLR